MSAKTPDRSKPGRKPTIAAHPACAEIKLARAAGDALQMIAGRFGVGRASVDRNWHGLPPERRACPARRRCNGAKGRPLFPSSWNDHSAEGSPGSSPCARRSAARHPSFPSRP